MYVLCPMCEYLRKGPSASGTDLSYTQSYQFVLDHLPITIQQPTSTCSYVIPMSFKMVIQLADTS